MMRLLAAVAIVLTLVSCGAAPSPTPSGDSRERILSLSPHATQMLEAFGVMDQVVGVTDFCPLPASHAAIPRVGGLMNPNVELMLSLRPTVAFHAPTARNLEVRLADAGVRVVALPNESLDDIHASILLMGRDLGLEAKADELVENSRSSLNQLARKLDGSHSPSVLCVIGHTPGSLRDIHAAGPDTFLDELITVAGGINRMADAPTRYPQVSREALIQRAPDVVLMAAPVGGWSDRDAEVLRRAWRELLGPSAARVRIEFLDDPSMTIPGPLVHQSAARFAHLIHGLPAED